MKSTMEALKQDNMVNTAVRATSPVGNVVRFSPTKVQIVALGLVHMMFDIKENVYWRFIVEKIHWTENI